MLNIQLLTEYLKNKKTVHVISDTEFPFHVRTIDTNKPLKKFATYEEARAYRAVEDSADGMSNL
jgi:hypothetical protein